MTTAPRATGQLSTARAVAKIPVQDLERARAFYRDKLGLEALEERDGGLRYCCAAGEFHLFVSSGRSSGTSTQLGFEVEDIEAAVAQLRSRGVDFGEFGAPGDSPIVEVGDNYPSKGTGERGTWFRDSEGNILSIGQAI